jgi:hypothetical protein
VNSVITRRFRALLGQLPESARQQASRAYSLWRADPHHPSLRFKRVSQQRPIYSVRVGLGYCVLGLWEGETITWFWIGSHAEYDTLLARLKGQQAIEWIRWRRVDSSWALGGGIPIGPGYRGTEIPSIWVVDLPSLTIRRHNWPSFRSLRRTGGSGTRSQQMNHS